MGDEHSIATSYEAPPVPAVEKTPAKLAVTFGDLETAESRPAEGAEPAVVDRGETASKESEVAATAEAEAPAEPTKLTKKQYEKDLDALRPAFLKLQQTVKEKGLKLVVLIDGRDTGRKGSVINRLAESADRRVCRVASLHPPSARERQQWFFQPFVPQLPAAGEVVLFDGSWYGRAVVERAFGLCGDEQYAERLGECAEFDQILMRSGIQIVKCWISAETESAEEAADLAKNIARTWNLSAKDFHADYAAVVRQILSGEGTGAWHVIASSDKREARLDCVRRLISAVPVETGEEPKSAMPMDEARPADAGVLVEAQL